METFTHYFPKKCCNCLAPSETTRRISKSYSSGMGKSVTYNIDVPICSCCNKKLNQQFWKKVLYGFIGFGLGSSLPQFLTENVNILGGLIPGGAIAGIIIGIMLYKTFNKNYINKPVKIFSNGELKFRNIEFDSLYKETNFSDEAKKLKEDEFYEEMRQRLQLKANAKKETLADSIKNTVVETLPWLKNIDSGGLDNTNTTINYASFISRTKAILLDAIIIFLFWFIYVLLMMGIFWFKGYFKEGDPPALVIATIPISLFLFAWLYFALQESSPYLGTWGKRKFGILVCDKSLNKITFAKATGRFWAKYLTVSTYGVGFLLYFFTNRKQTLHDLICKTIVINNNN